MGWRCCRRATSAAVASAASVRRSSSDALAPPGGAGEAVVRRIVDVHQRERIEVASGFRQQRDEGDGLRGASRVDEVAGAFTTARAFGAERAVGSTDEGDQALPYMFPLIMALQNRVTPFNEIVSTPQRYELPWARMGNRGVLHKDRKIVRHSNSKAWLICQLKYKNRKRPLMAPGKYTELFFLDDYVGLAAGHRFCAQCRRADFLLYGRKAKDLDALLAHERGRRLPVRDLPDGAMIAVGDDAYLYWHGKYWLYSHDGYAEADPDVSNGEVLTPPTSLAVLRKWRPYDDIPLKT